MGFQGRFGGFWRHSSGGVELVEELVGDWWGWFGGFEDLMMSFFTFFYKKIKNPT